MVVAALASARGASRRASGADAPSGPPPSAHGAPDSSPATAIVRPPFPGEQRRLRNIHQLTFGGENAEAYWSFDDQLVVFQSTRPPYTADQIFVMKPDGSDLRLVSTGKGRTTCAYFLPVDSRSPSGPRIIYASTHHLGDAPPAPPDKSSGYVWGLFDYDLYTVDLEGKETVRLTNTPGYDAEATVSPRGDRMVFTSVRDGDLDLYSMRLDGTEVVRLTDTLGYDGGAVWSPDGSKIAWRAQHPRTDAEKEAYRGLLARGLVRPSRLDLWVMDANGTNKRRVTSYDKASFGPFFTPDGRRLLFASNLDDTRGRSFELYLIGLDGTGLERVTFFSNERADDFDGFPMFSFSGKRLLFCSNRFNERPNETNVFVADWVD